jgi:hypothetical protein
VSFSATFWTLLLSSRTAAAFLANTGWRARGPFDLPQATSASSTMPRKVSFPFSSLTTTTTQHTQKNAALDRSSHESPNPKTRRQSRHAERGRARLCRFAHPIGILMAERSFIIALPSKQPVVACFDCIEQRRHGNRETFSLRRLRLPTITHKTTIPSTQLRARQQFLVHTQGNKTRCIWWILLDHFLFISWILFFASWFHFFFFCPFLGRSIRWCLTFFFFDKLFLDDAFSLLRNT